MMLSLDLRIEGPGISYRVGPSFGAAVSPILVQRESVLLQRESDLLQCSLDLQAVVIIYILFLFQSPLLSTSALSTHVDDEVR